MSISRQGWLVISGAGALLAFCLAAALRVLAVRAFDFPVILAVNTIARRSQVVDHALQGFATFDLFQGLPLVALACGAFAASGCGRARVRIMIGVVGASTAAILSRLLQFILPSLARPTVDPALPFRRPYGGVPELWRGWSSFPSDHATLLWGIAFATLMVNRRIGAISVVAASLASLARLYCGLHYATDIVGGALLGVAVVCAFAAAAAPLEVRLLSFAKQRPALVATVAFLFAAQAATLFYDLRTVGEIAVHNIKELGAAGEAAQAAAGQEAGSAVRPPLLESRHLEHGFDQERP